MALDISKFRKLVSLDEKDPLSRFALGQALFREGTGEAAREATDHLLFAKTHAPNHLATYHVLAQVLIKIGRTDEARTVLGEGCEKSKGMGECTGQDLGPVMAEMLESL